MRVGVFVGTRADLGPLETVIAALADASDIELIVLGGVAFAAEDLRVLLSDDAMSVTVRSLATPVSVIDKDAMVTQGALLAEGLRELHDSAPLDALVVLGDRWELLSVASTAFLLGIRIVHLHGGEVTEGALDERVRHAVTKLADVHCVASSDAKRRVLQLGEAPERIRVTGAPGLDRLVGIEPATDDDLETLAQRSVGRPLVLFTYHPETADGARSPGENAREALRGVLEHAHTVIATDPGMDAGRDEILTVLDEMAAADSRIVRVRSLGPRYPRVLAAVDAVVGNSSSGVIEAASVGVPAVDVGRRQQGRLRAESVVHAEGSAQSVADSLAMVLSDTARAAARETVNPYGNGAAASLVVDAVRFAATLPETKTFVTIGDAR